MWECNSNNDRYSKNVNAGHEVPSLDVAVTVGCAMSAHKFCVCVCVRERVRDNIWAGGNSRGRICGENSRGRTYGENSRGTVYGVNSRHVIYGEKLRGRI
jgi:hypothetical protein